MPETETGVRVVSTLENMSPCVSGVWFAPLPANGDGKSAGCMSAPIAETQAERFCQIEGYQRATAAELAHAAEIDAAIEQARERSDPAVVANQGALGDAQRTIAELQQTNILVSEERDRYRAEAERLRAGGAVGGDEQLVKEIEALRTEGAALRAKIEAAEAENEQLRRANEALDTGEPKKRGRRSA
jgi:hypothetical protein